MTNISTIICEKDKPKPFYVCFTCFDFKIFSAFFFRIFSEEVIFKLNILRNKNVWLNGNRNWFCKISEGHSSWFNIFINLCIYTKPFFKHKERYYIDTILKQLFSVLLFEVGPLVSSSIQTELKSNSNRFEFQICAIKLI